MKNKYSVIGDEIVVYINRRNGQVLEMLISAEDLPKFQEYTGSVNVFDKGKGRYYAYVRFTVNGESKYIMVHRWLMNEPPNLMVDHIDGNCLRNTRDNLRVATASQNGLNRKGANPNSKTGIRGVSRLPGKKKRPWRAMCQVDGQIVYRQYFTNKRDAELAIIRFRHKNVPYSSDALKPYPRRRRSS